METTERVELLISYLKTLDVDREHSDRERIKKEIEFQLDVPKHR